MKRNQVLCTFVLVTVLLSGCGAKQAVQGSGAAAASTDTATTATATPAQAKTTDQKQDASKQQEPANGQGNQKQMQMMMIFRTLTTMDKAEGLSITKAQAEKMIPIVQASITSGELTTDQNTQLIAQLTDAQKTYVETEAAKNLWAAIETAVHPKGTQLQVFSQRSETAEC